jgi:serine/threonine protein kinase
MQTFDAAMALSIAQQVAAGLKHVHKSGVVHRDVRAANVIVISLEPLRVVLADFGVSRRLASRRWCRRCRGSGAIVVPSPDRAVAARGDGQGRYHHTLGGGMESKAVVDRDAEYGVDPTGAAGGAGAFVVPPATEPLSLNDKHEDTNPGTVARSERRRSSAIAVGPVAWMAPEVLAGSEAVRGATTASDVYMFGGLLFEILTSGVRPFYWIVGE